MQNFYVILSTENNGFPNNDMLQISVMKIDVNRTGITEIDNEYVDPHYKVSQDWFPRMQTSFYRIHGKKIDEVT